MSFLFYSRFFSFSFFLSISLFSSLFLCFYFLYLSISSIHSEQMGRGPFPSRLRKKLLSMSAVRQLHGRQAYCNGQSMCSEPLSSTSADVHGTSEWPLLPPKLAWQWTEAVFVNKEPVNKVKLIKNKRA